MKFPLSWLKEYIDIGLPAQQIAKILTLAGIEVDSIERAALNFDKVVIGEILSVSPHPNADKLVIVQVTDGLETFQVVCGAPNCIEGMKTAFALIGSNINLSDGTQIKVKKTKIRGIESFGMLCSGFELGISAESDGIIEFADYLKTGADVAEMYSDSIFEVSLTPNLSHASSLIGIARELSAATGSPLKLPSIAVKEESTPISDEVTLEVQDDIDCPTYACRLVEGLFTRESPSWMKKRLEACGVRPIHVAVDVTNYVLIEMGQPLHAFDFEKVESGKIVVRRAKPNEKIITLDDKEHTLNESMLVIADPIKALAVAGVMGGKNSEVTSGTQKILIESALFRATSIRKTSKALGILTDASKRFERGVDPEGIIPALNRAVMLLKEIAGAKVAKGTCLKSTYAAAPLEVLCRVERVNGLLGTHLSEGEIEAIFQRLQFHTTIGEGKALLVKIPSYRIDIKAEVDLIEEVARMIGYDNIPRQNVRYTTSELPENPVYRFEKEVRSRLVGSGLQEFLTCDLIGPSLLGIAKDPKIPEDAQIHVLNPTSIEQSILRSSLLQGLLQVVKFNHDHENPNVSGFEVGRVHFKTLDGHFQEPTVAGIIVSGKSQPHHIDPHPRDVDFYDLKGIIENLLESLNIKRYVFRFSHIETFHSGRQALIQVDGVDIGSLGEIHPMIQKKLDVPTRIYFAEINLIDLLKAKKGDLTSKQTSEFPSSSRDWTVTVSEDMPVQQLLGSVQHIPSTILEEVTLKDIFRSDKLGPDLKNVTLHFVYRDKKKTVSQEEVDFEHARIVTQAEKMLGTYSSPDAQVSNPS